MYIVYDSNDFQIATNRSAIKIREQLIWKNATFTLNSPKVLTIFQFSYWIIFIIFLVIIGWGCKMIKINRTCKLVLTQFHSPWELRQKPTPNKEQEKYLQCTITEVLSYWIMLNFFLLTKNMFSVSIVRVSSSLQTVTRSFIHAHSIKCRLFVYFHSVHITLPFVICALSFLY